MALVYRLVSCQVESEWAAGFAGLSVVCLEVDPRLWGLLFGTRKRPEGCSESSVGSGLAVMRAWKDAVEGEC